MKLFLLLLFFIFSLNFVFPNIVSANSISLYSKINQRVIFRFDEDINKLSAIMEELKERLGIEGQKTLVAFGTPQNPYESADYWINFAAEASAYQKIQKYSSKNDLNYSLQVLANKILRAKAEVKKALK